MRNPVYRYLFRKDMKKTEFYLRSAWRKIKTADRYMSNKCNFDDEKKPDNRTHALNVYAVASRSLLEAHKHLVSASTFVSDIDPAERLQIVEIILEHDDPVRYCNFYGLDYANNLRDCMYKFGSKEIQKKWQEQKTMFVKHSKHLVNYDELLGKWSY